MSVPRIVLFGTGYWGSNLARSLASLGALHSMVDERTDRALACAKRYGVSVHVKRSVLTDPDVDAVVLATPAATHANLAIEALHAGKHVLVENPMALSVRDGEKVAKAARESGKVMMVGHLLNHHPAFVKLKSLTREGKLGTLRHIESSHRNFGKLRHTESVHWSVAPHSVYMILELAGRKLPAITGHAHQVLNRKKIADIAHFDLKFSGGLTAHITASWLHPYKERSLVVIGDKGTAVLDDCQSWDKKLVFFSNTVKWANGAPVLVKGVEEPVALGKEVEPLREECQHFIDCIKQQHQGFRPVDGPDEGLQTLLMLSKMDDAAGDSIWALMGRCFSSWDTC